MILAPDEPPPFEVVNPGGGRPLILVCDHATRFVPRSLNLLGLDETVLQRHIAWDIGIAEVTRRLAARLDAPAVFSHFSRLLVDPNRHFKDPTLIPQISDGVIVPANRHLDPAMREARIAAFHRPYHGAIGRVVEGRLNAGQVPVLLSMHSFTPVLKGRERPWKIGILWNRDPRLPLPLIHHLRGRGIPVGDNEPYSGRDGHGYTLHVHAEPRGLAHALVEVRQDLIDTQHGAAEWARILGDSLEAVLEDPELNQIQDHRKASAMARTS